MKAIMYDKQGKIKREIELNNFVTIDLFMVQEWCSKIIFTTEDKK